MPDYSKRLQAVQSTMAEQAVDLIFLPISADLRYLTGIGREEPNFGNTMYPGEWLTGAWIPQSGAPILTLPRMMAEFHMGAVTGFDIRILPDAADPLGLVADVLKALSIGATASIATGDRAWAEALLNLQKLRPEASFGRPRR